jgi:hypothetical protein
VSRSRLTFLAVLPPAVLGALALIWLGFLLLRQAWWLGLPELAMVSLTLLFVVVLPLALPVLSWAARRRLRTQRRAIVPITGVKVP